jgi:hypothetical protein
MRAYGGPGLRPDASLAFFTLTTNEASREIRLRADATLEESPFRAKTPCGPANRRRLPRKAHPALEESKCSILHPLFEDDTRNLDRR